MYIDKSQRWFYNLARSGGVVMAYSKYQDDIDRKRYAGHTFMEDQNGNLMRAENGSPLFYEPYNPNSGLEPYYKKVTVQQTAKPIEVQIPPTETRTIIQQPIVQPVVYYQQPIKVVPYTCIGYPLNFNYYPNIQTKPCDQCMQTSKPNDFDFELESTTTTYSFSKPNIKKPAYPKNMANKNLGGRQQ